MVEAGVYACILSDNTGDVKTNIMDSEYRYLQHNVQQQWVCISTIQTPREESLKIKYKKFCLLSCHHQLGKSECLNIDYCINNSLLHMIYTLSLPFPFIMEPNRSPAFWFFLGQIAFFMTHVKKSSNPLQVWTNLRTFSYF